IDSSASTVTSFFPCNNSTGAVSCETRSMGRGSAPESLSRRSPAIATTARTSTPDEATSVATVPPQDQPTSPRSFTRTPGSPRAASTNTTAVLVACRPGEPDGSREQLTTGGKSGRGPDQQPATTTYPKAANFPAQSRNGRPSPPLPWKATRTGNGPGPDGR